MATISKLREPMAEAALAFLESLDAGGREATLHPLSPDRHRDWHYTPRDGRPGLPLKRMSAEQRALVFALLASALSEEGLRKTRSIIKLEGILGELTGRPDFRDPENYALGDLRRPGRQNALGLALRGPPRLAHLHDRAWPGHCRDAGVLWREPGRGAGGP